MKKEAIAVYDILLQKNPYSSEAQRLKAVVLLKDSSDPEDRKAGELMLRTSNRSDPNNPMTYIDLFNLYMKDNQPELAVSVVEEAFSTLGKTPTLLLPFAKGFFSYALIKSKELGQSSNHWMQESFQLLEQYFEINGYDIEALQLATRVTSNLFKIEKTILYGKLYLDLGGKSYFALQNLGSALRQVGDFAESIPVIKKYIDETDPRYKSKKYYLDCFFLGHSYLMISDYKNAVKYFLIATGSKYPNKNIYKNLAFAFQGMGQSVEAAQAMEKAFELDTRDFIAADFLTHIYSELGDFENATFYSKIRSKLKY